MEDANALVDRIAVADVLTRYGSSLDESDWERLATCFVPEVTSVLAGGGPISGYADLEAAVRVALGAYERTQHHIAGHEVEIAGDEATLRANLIATHVHDGTTFVVGGVYREKLVRTPHGWRIIYHELDALWMEGT